MRMSSCLQYTAVNDNSGRGRAVMVGKAYLSLSGSRECSIPQAARRERVSGGTRLPVSVSR